MRKTYLVHHGIKGQRWGVRRYQNEDGSLTPLGKKKYNTANDPDYDPNYDPKSQDALTLDYKKKDAAGAKAILEGTSKIANDSANTIGNIGKNKSKTVNDKDYSKMSDDEIRSKINRLTMERNYGELTGDTKRVRTGQDWTREILQTTGAVVGVAGTIATIVLTIREIKSKTPGSGKKGK